MNQNLPDNQGDGGELAVQVQLAQRIPRDINQFRQTALAMIQTSPDVAADCFYKLPPRKDKRTGREVVIEGPSIRLAEIALNCWGRAKVGGRIIRETDTHVVAQGVFVDLQSLLFISVEVNRRITNRDGQRFSEDMVVMAQNDAISRAIRNATFRGIPKALIDPLYEAARKFAVGDVKSFADRRALMVKAYSKMGVQIPQILKKVGKTTLEEITAEDLEMLLGLGTAIKDKDANIDEEFPVIKEEAPVEKVADVVPGVTPTQPEASRPETSLQIFNRLAARVKKELGLDARAKILGEIGVRADVFPSKMSEDDLTKANQAMQTALNPDVMTAEAPGADQSK